MTVTTISISRLATKRKFALKGKVILGGTVKASYRKKTMRKCGFMDLDRCASYSTKYRILNLSDILSPDELTFDIEGYASMSSSKSSQTNISFVERAMDNESCELLLKKKDIDAISVEADSPFSRLLEQGKLDIPDDIMTSGMDH